MFCLVKAGVQVPSAAIMNFPKLALSVGVAEAGRRVSPRSRSTPALSKVRAMKLKWGKMGKRGRRQCTGCPAEKTKKKLRRARKQTILRSRIWLAYAPLVNHNYIDLVLRLRFTKIHDPYQELSDYSFEECLAAALLVRFNQTPPARAGSPPPPSTSTVARGRRSHDVHAEYRKAAGVWREGKHSVPVDLAINFSPSQHFGLPTSMRAPLP
jgi:hypothetical protein